MLLQTHSEVGGCEVAFRPGRIGDAFLEALGVTPPNLPLAGGCRDTHLQRVNASRDYVLAAEATLAAKDHLVR